ncbi:hypothetical protein [Ferruginibacter sp.]
MSRKLEKFIGDNRNEFDDRIPSDKVWEKLAADLVPQQKKKAVLMPLYKWSIAAAVLIIASITVFLVLRTTKPTGERELAEGPKKDTIKDIAIITPENPPEVNEVAKLVALKQDELKALAPEQPELYKTFATDINQLDSSYKSLKSQFGTTPNKEVLIEAMIQNLQLQLNVLNQQLTIVNQIKKTKRA